MSKVSNLRLLLPSSSSLFLSKKPFLLSPFSHSLFSKPSLPRKTYFAPITALSYAGRHRRRGRGGGGGVSPQRRGNSTLREGGERDKERGRMVDMEEGEDLSFNKRRAEGRDRSGKGKALQLKTRKLNPVNTICYLQILGTGMDTQDTSPSILLFFDKQRFIFNAGEGLQRFCTEHKIKLSKIDHIFLTRVCSETAGGLPGLVLTLAGIGEEGMSVNIWGPSDIDFLVEAMRSFIPKKAMLHTHSFGLNQNNGRGSSPTSGNGKSIDPVVLVDDEVVRISAFFVKPGYSKSFINNLKAPNLDLLDGENYSSQYAYPKAQSSESLHSETEFNLKPGDTAVVYACELPEIKGKFDPVKAASLGLKPGPKYRELQLGNSVLSDRLNIMVNPSDVLGPSSPGPIVLLVDCPTMSHMHELLSLQSLSCYYANSSTHSTEGVKIVNCIIHLGPSSVTKSIEYQNWMRRFGNAQHIMAGHEIKNTKIPILKASARISSRLNYVCPQLFPAPGLQSAEQINNLPLEKSVNAEGTSLTLCKSTSAENLLKSTSAENLLKFNLRPHSLLGLDKSAIPGTLSHKEIVEELFSEIPEIKDISKQISQFWGSPLQNNSMVPLEDDNIIMVEEPWINESSLVPIEHMQKKRLDVSEDGSPYLAAHLIKGLEENLDIPSCLENITREDMEVILLGTGSSQPSKYRNVSSVFVNLFARGSLLLDCGEGTLAQLKRRFGVKGADNAVTSLRCIWISHIHADHHTGLVRILALRCQLLKGVPHKPLLVIGPRPLERFLKAYSELEDLDMQFLDCRHTLKTTVESLLSNHGSGRGDSADSNYESNRGAGLATVTSHQLESTLFAPGSRMESYRKKPGIPVEASMALISLREVLFEAGLEFLHSVPVLHCPEAFGVALKSREKVNSRGKTIPGWKLVYSGDTRPCPALIDASNDATVLIHEATFEDSMKDEAINRNHSTTKEAIGVGTSAGAYRIILTHFSQRYPKIPVFDETDMHKTCIAFDLMSVNLADLPVLPNVLPYLKVLFRNEMMADESDDALRLIKYAVGKSGNEFRREMQRHSVAIRQLCHYKGQPDPLKGDSLNKAVRETAQEAVSTVFSSDDSKPTAPAEGLNKRIQGFGNTNFETLSEDKKSFISEVVGLGSASIKQGLSNFAAAHSMMKNDNGTYKSPTLRRSLTTENNRHDKYEANGNHSETWVSSGVSKNVASGTWGADSRTSITGPAPTEYSRSSNSGVKSREERLLETIVTCGGVRLQPTRDALQVFLSEVSKLDPLAMSSALEVKLQSPIWQVRMKAICVLESILRKKDDESFSCIASYFSENRESVVKCSELPQVSLRDKATKVLNLLDGEQSAQTRNVMEHSHAKAVSEPVVQMPDLIDTGDLDNNGGDIFSQKHHDQSISNLTEENSSVDDLLGGNPISELSTGGNRDGSDPFADVSFHVAEDKEPNDLFSGLTLDDKSSNVKHDMPSTSNPELLDIFGGNSEHLYQETVTDKRHNQLLADLTLTGMAQGQPRMVGESGGILTGFSDQNSQPSEVPNSGASNIIFGPNSFFPEVPMQYNMPPSIMLNEGYAAQPLNYGSMGNLIAQQQLLYQNLGNFNPGFGHEVAKDGYPSALPDIFQLSHNPVQKHGSMMTNMKKEETKAFDFVSDHLAAVRGSKRVI
ncbi:tRNAse Z TRZ4, mitochondrial-like [Typha angustifolia]|uniref:tRNAse Z TRZ4, mitochondrial-like n=1 Tax=Typha angustifolia TaxID=59011 RepID=UPI003C2D6B9A